MPPQLCLIGWPPSAVQSLLADFGSPGAPADRINTEVQTALAGAVHGVAGTLAGPTSAFEGELAPQFAAARALGAGGPLCFGGPAFAPTWRFWARALPDLRPVLLIPPPPSQAGHDGLEGWFTTSVTGLQQTHGTPRTVLVGSGGTAAATAIRVSLESGETPSIRRLDGGIALDWLDCPELPAPAAVLYLGLELLAARARDLAVHEVDALLTEVAEAAGHGWRMAGRAGDELAAAQFVHDDLRAAAADAEQRVAASRLECAAMVEAHDEREASLRSEIEALGHERRNLEAQLVAARSYIALVQGTPVYRGFAAARAARERLRALLVRR